MSRSRPTTENPNPSTRWFEWNGEHGKVSYYDRETKKNVDVGDDFTFIYLDELATVKGWHEPSESGIYANEVRDTRDERFLVKAFKGGVLAEGFYKDVKDRIKAHGGHYVANIYIGYRTKDGLAIGSIQFKGAALNEWVEFSRKNKADLTKKAVRINGSKEGKKGKVVFKTPIFAFKDITEETDKEAVELDGALQTYFDAYFARNKTEQVVSHGEEPAQDDPSLEYSEPEKPRGRQQEPDLDEPADDSEPW